VVGLLLLEPLRFGFITQPTKRRLPFQFISEAIAADRVAEFFRALRSNSARHAASTSGSAIPISHALLDRAASRFCASHTAAPVR
jgi:hypothetical protein